MTDEEKAEKYILSLGLEKGNKILQLKEVILAMYQTYLKGLAEGRKEKELSYEVEEVTKAELNKCKTIEEKMEWLGKVLGQAIFKNDMNYAVWVNLQKNNIIEQLEKENAELKEKIKHRNCIDCSNHGKQIEVLKLKAQIEHMKCCENCKHYYGCDGGVELCNKWEMVE